MRAPSLLLLPLCAALATALPLRAGGLEEDVRQLVAKEGLSKAAIGICVLDERGAPLVSLGDAQPLKPASNQKILTTATALRRLGEAYQHETLILTPTPLSGGVVRGDIVIVGGGDPNISGRFYDGDGMALLRRWASDLKGAGLMSVEGDIVGDESLMEAERFHPDWDARQSERWYSAQVSALAINDNCLDVVVRPGPLPGAEADVSWTPRAPELKVVANVRTSASGKAKVILRRKPGGNRITVEGTLPLRSSPWKGEVTLDDPAAVFAGAFREALLDAGVRVRGVARTRSLSTEPGVREPAAAPGTEASGARPSGAPEPGLVQPGSQLLVRHRSSLLQDLPIIHKRSQNLHAELLFKLTARAVTGRGSWEGGAAAVRAHVEGLGIPLDGLVVRDGSGLSHENRVSARVLAQVLHAVRGRPYFSAYYDSLPVGGEDGTLARRFGPGSLARGHVHAKTGYIAGVSALSGYIEQGGRIWTFSIIANGLRGGPSPARDLQDAVVERLARALRAAGPPRDARPAAPPAASPPG